MLPNQGFKDLKFVYFDFLYLKNNKSFKIHYKSCLKPMYNR